MPIPPDQRCTGINAWQKSGWPVLARDHEHLVGIAHRQRLPPQLRRQRHLARLVRLPENHDVRITRVVHQRERTVGPAQVSLAHPLREHVLTARGI